MSKESIDINKLVKKAIRDFEDQISFYRLALNLTEDYQLSVNMNKDLATILITNLIKNAIVHNHSGASIDIIINKKSLVIKNSGSEVPLNESEIFRRFNKGKQSHASTGLGLAIAKAIAQLFNFTIRYHFDQKHTLTVEFDQ